MNQPPPVTSPLTPDQIGRLRDYLRTTCPRCQCRLDSMRQAGLPNELAEQELAALRDLCISILRVYAPNEIE